MRRVAVVLACLLSMVASDPASTAAVASTTAVARTIARPDIVRRPIPFGPRRKRQMAAYSERHYGRRTYELTAPHVIVEHYTDGTTFQSAWNTFASNAVHLGEKPGTCAHFIIDTDGTIYQLVRLKIRCRHVIGLNQTSIGIEHVGTSDRQILRNDAMMRASLHLTLWLMQHFGINVGNVIGHAESLMSPYHRELYPSWRCMTHSDWLHRDMRIYRRRLRDLAQAKGVPGGAGPHWGNDCT
jgi:N-acetylmuramoyl-L-alanine amidase